MTRQFSQLDADRDGSLSAAEFAALQGTGASERVVSASGRTNELGVLIGADGKVVRRWDGVKVDGHAEEVLAAVETL